MTTPSRPNNKSTQATMRKQHLHELRAMCLAIFPRYPDAALEMASRPAPKPHWHMGLYAI